MSREDFYKNIPILTTTVSIAVVPLALAYNISFFLGFAYKNYILAKALLSLMSLSDYIQSTLNLIAGLFLFYPIYLIVISFLLMMKGEMFEGGRAQGAYASERKESDRKKFTLMYGDSLGGSYFRDKYERIGKFEIGFFSLFFIYIILIPIFLSGNKFWFILGVANSWLVLFGFILIPHNPSKLKQTPKLSWATTIIPPLFIILSGFGYLEGAAIRSGKSNLEIVKTGCVFVRAVNDNFLCYVKKSDIVMLCSKELKCAEFFDLKTVQSNDWFNYYRHAEFSMPDIKNLNTKVK